MAPASPSANPKLRSQRIAGFDWRRSETRRRAGRLDEAPREDRTFRSRAEPRRARASSWGSRIGSSSGCWSPCSMRSASCPISFFIRLGVACGLIFHRFDHRHRRIGIRNLEIAFPEKSDVERKRILRASYINLGRRGAEYVRLGGFFYRRLGRRVTYNRARRLERAHAEVSRQGRADPDGAFRRLRAAAGGPRAARLPDKPGASHAALPGGRRPGVVHPRARGSADNPQAYGGARDAAVAASAARSSASRSTRTPSAPKQSGSRSSASWPRPPAASIASR